MSKTILVCCKMCKVFCHWPLFVDDYSSSYIPFISIEKEEFVIASNERMHTEDSM